MENHLEFNESDQNKDNIECPVCGEAFEDRRGLTSHARHRHGINKSDLYISLEKGKKESWSILKYLGGISATILLLLGLGRLK